MATDKSAPILSFEEFAKNLAESGLFESFDPQPDSAQITAPDGPSAARELVAAGKLTAFQANALLSGRFSDLRMGNYDILDRLGAGAMGTVFKARHRRMKRLVALKVLTAQAAGTAKFAHRFQREVETIARLTHPNIVMAFDADECEAGPFLVMEFVNGRDLAYEVNVGGPMALASAVDRILQAARGLEYAHNQGIVHRDIKPGNILRDVDGVVKVADLGLARLSATHDESDNNTAITQAGGVLGTVEYMAPEQAMDSTTVDHRADIYSLGCTLYYLLTARQPFQAGSILAMMIKHRDGPIPSLREDRCDVPAELEAIFRRMVAKSPSDRFQSMGEVVQALESLVRTGLGVARMPDAPPSSESAASANGSTVALEPGAAAPFQDTIQFAVSPVDTGSLHAKSGAERLAGRAVVLVEPSRTQAGIIRRYVQQLGIDSVHITGSGRDALNLAKREKAGVIISSMHLSDMTGVQLARALLADPECSGVGFVLATSEADTQATDPLPQSPRTALMLKPFDLARLNQAISAIVHRLFS